MLCDEGYHTGEDLSSCTQCPSYLGIADGEMEEVNENGSKSADGKSVTIKPKDSASIVLGLSLIFFVFIIIYM